MEDSLLLLFLVVDKDVIDVDATAIEGIVLVILEDIGDDSEDNGGT